MRLTRSTKARLGCDESYGSPRLAPARAPGAARALNEIGATDRPQICQQVCHLLMAYALLQSFRHERHARAAQLVDVDAQDRLAGAVGPADRDAGRRLRGDHAGQRAATVRDDEIRDELRQHLAVRIEDVEQHEFRPAILDPRDIGANLLADAFEAMAD